MTTTQDSTEDWLDDLLEQAAQGIEHSGCDDSCSERNFYPEAESKIRQHMLSEALVLIGEDDNEVRGTTQSPDNPNYWTKRTKHRNELKAELRQAFTEKYGERE